MSKRKSKIIIDKYPGYGKWVEPNSFNGDKKTERCLPECKNIWSTEQGAHCLKCGFNWY